MNVDDMKDSVSVSPQPYVKSPTHRGHEDNGSCRGRRSSLGRLSPDNDLSYGDEEGVHVDQGVDKPSRGYDSVGACTGRSRVSWGAEHWARLEERRIQG